MSVLTDLRDRLVEAGVTAHVALGRLPDSPDALIAFRDYPAGPSRDFSGDNLPALESLAVQMLARGSRDAGLAVVEALAWEAYRALTGRHARVNGASYDWIHPQHAPAPLGVDANDRPIYVVNWTIQRWGDVVREEVEA